MLGGAVCTDVSIALDCSRTGHIDDAAPAACAHFFVYGPGAVENTIQVDGHHTVPMCNIHFVKWYRVSGPGIVNQDLNRSQFSLGLLKRNPDMIGMRHITGHAAGIFEGCRCGFQGR